MISCVFADAFRSRANEYMSLQRMQLSESVVYQYLNFLRETGAAPTLADATVKAIWFMHSTANIQRFSHHASLEFAGTCI